MAEDLIEGPPLLRSDHLRLIHRGGADLAGGYVDDAPQPQIIGGVVDNAQIGQHILDLGPVKELQTTVDLIGDAAALAGVFQRVGLGVHTVQNRMVAVLFASFHLFQNSIRNIGRLVRFVCCSVPRDLLPCSGIGPEMLGLSAGIVGNHAVGSVQNILGGTIILFQTNHGAVRKFFFESENVFDRRSAEPVDTLVIITHNTKVSAGMSQQRNQLILSMVRVLILVDEHIAEFPLIEGPHVLVLLEQADRVEDDVVKVQRVGRPELFGIGGVGGYVCEALVRSGVEAFDLIDDDKVCLTNLNRQIIATRSTVGKYKTQVMKDRILDINPNADVRIHECFFLPENADDFPWDEYDYIVDAVDTVTAKIALVMKAQEKNIPIISSMGAGNKLDGSQFKVADIYKTKVCPLAKVMRRELKKRGIKKLKVVYSEEQPTRPIEDMSSSCKNHCICPPGATHKCTERRDIPGSVAFVPSIVGLIIGGEVVKDLAAKQK